MFKHKPEYKTNTGLVVYHLGQETQCPTCGCHVAHTPQTIELPSDPSVYKGYFDKMMRQMAENHARVTSNNKEAQRNAAEIDLYLMSHSYPGDLSYSRRHELINSFICAYLECHPGTRIGEIELVERRVNNGVKWFIQKKI